jgi:competence protein ComGC
MKNIVENIVVMLVVIFSVAIVVLIVWYNLIEDKSMAHFNTSTTAVEQVSQKQKNTSYIKNIETYKEVDVKVNPRKENHFNRVKVKSEIKKDNLNTIIES